MCIVQWVGFCNVSVAILKLVEIALLLMVNLLPNLYELFLKVRVYRY